MFFGSPAVQFRFPIFAEIAVPEMQLQYQKVKPVMMRVTYLLLFLMAGCARSQEAPKAGQEVPKAEEGTYFALGEPALMVKLPGPVEVKEANIPNETISQLKRFDTYQYVHPSNKMMGIFQFAQYATFIQNSPEEALMKGVERMFKSVNSTDGEFSTEELIFGAHHGRKAIGSFTYNGKPWTFNSIVFIRADGMWQIWMAAEKNDPASMQMLQSATESLYFK